MIRRNIDLESQLIDDLLDLTQITRDKLQLQLEPLDAHIAIAKVAEMCAAEIGAKNLRLSLDLRAGGSPHRSRCAEVSADHLEPAQERHQVYRRKWRRSRSRQRIQRPKA